MQVKYAVSLTLNLKIFVWNRDYILPKQTMFPIKVNFQFSRFILNNTNNRLYSILSSKVCHKSCDTLFIDQVIKLLCTDKICRFMGNFPKSPHFFKIKDISEITCVVVFVQIYGYYGLELDEFCALSLYELICYCRMEYV